MKLALKLPGQQTINPPAELQHTLTATNYGLSYVGVLVGVLYFIAILLALGFLAYGGIKWISSEGDAKNIAGARTMIRNAVIGLVLVFFSFLIVNVISSVLGVSLLAP